MNSLEVQWLGLHALTAKGLGLISGQGTRIPQAVQCDQKQKKTTYIYCDYWLVLFLFCCFCFSFLCFVLPLCGLLWVCFRISFWLIWGVFECFSLCVFFFFFKVVALPLIWASLIAQLVNHLPAMQETQVRSLGWEDPLEEEMVTHSSILAWRMDRGAW